MCPSSDRNTFQPKATKGQAQAQAKGDRRWKMLTSMPFSEWFFMIFQSMENGLNHSSNSIVISVPMDAHVNYISHDVWSNFLYSQLLNLFCLFHHIGARPSLKILRSTYALTVNSWHHFAIASFSSACHLLKVAEGLALWPRSVVWGQAAYRYRPPTCCHISERLMKTHNFDSW